MTKIARSGSISQRHGSADPDPDPHQCHGSATLSGTEDKTVVHAAPTAGTTVPGTGKIYTPDDKARFIII